MFRHGLVRSLVLHYADRAGYDGPPIRLFTREASWRRHFRNRGGLPVGHAPDNLGETVRFKTHTAIFIDLGRHIALRQVEDTVRHEVTHAKRGPRHTRWFWSDLDELKRDA